MQKEVFKEELKKTIKESYEKVLFFESLNRKKELSLAEAVYVLSMEEQLLNEGLFGNMGGLLDKGIETIINQLVKAKDSVAEWLITKLGGQVVKKPEGTKNPFDGAKTILPIAKMAKDDKEGFFQKVASMTGNTAAAIKDLYMKVEGWYESIPLVGAIAKKIPKGWRSVVLAALVAVVAGIVYYKSQSGAGGAGKAPEVKPGAPAAAPKAPDAPAAAPKAPDAPAAPKAPEAPAAAPKAPEAAPAAPKAPDAAPKAPTSTSVLDNAFNPTPEQATAMNKFAAALSRNAEHVGAKSEAMARGGIMAALRQMGAAAQSDNIEVFKKTLMQFAKNYNLDPTKPEDLKMLEQIIDIAKMGKK